METRFQTSFIPKKPLPSVGGASASVGIPSAPRRKNTSFFMGFAAFVFILSLAGVGAAYGWKAVLKSSQESYKKQLAEREKQFNLDLIEQLKQVNVKIDLGKSLLANHIAASQIFDIISRLTIENVRFLSMDVTAPANPADGMKISMRGYGSSFSAVAFQSDVLGQLEQYGLRRVVKNPILSDPALDQGGTVAFGFTATIDPAGISYEKLISSTAASAATSSPSGQ